MAEKRKPLEKVEEKNRQQRKAGSLKRCFKEY